GALSGPRGRSRPRPVPSRRSPDGPRSAARARASPTSRPARTRRRLRPRKPASPRRASPPRRARTCSRDLFSRRHAPRRRRSWSSPTRRSRPTRARRWEPRTRRRRAAQARRRCATRRPLLPPRQRLLELREHAAQRLLHHADTLRIPLDHRLRHLLGLHPRDVRRQRRHLRVGLDFEYARPARGERLLPCVAHLVTVLAVDPAEAEQLRVLRVRDARDPLRARVLRVADEDSLLPRHLVQVLVVEDAEDERAVAQPLLVALDRDQLVHPVHLEGAVAD